MKLPTEQNRIQMGLIDLNLSSIMFIMQQVHHVIVDHGQVQGSSSSHILGVSLRHTVGTMPVDGYGKTQLA